jgi:hypothetical protein
MFVLLICPCYLRWLPAGSQARSAGTSAEMRSTLMPW